MSQRSFTSGRRAPSAGVSRVAILSLGLSACSKQKSGSPPSQGTPAPASSALPASAIAEGTPALRRRPPRLSSYHASACR